MSEKNKQQKLKIIILDFDDVKNPLLNAGQACATLEVAKRLVKKGHRVEVISSKYPGYQNRIEEGIYYKHIGFGSKNIRINNIFYILSLPFHVMSLKADIVVECFTSPMSTLFSPFFTRIPVVVIPSCFDAERFSRLYHFPFWRIESFGCRFYKYILPYSQYLVDKIKQFNSKIIYKIVPEGVGEEFFQIEKKLPKHILFLGRLDIDQKGIDLLLRAYSKISNEISWPLVIAGNGPDEEKAKLLIKELHLENRVIMTGATYGEKKAQYLSEALFVAFPSRNETFSLFALEALASGSPLIAFDIPGLSWNDSRVALKAKPFDIGDYASILIKAALDKDLISQMSINARNFAKDFTWDNVSNGYESFFYEVIEREKQNGNIKY